MRKSVGGGGGERPFDEFDDTFAKWIVQVQAE